MGNLNDTTAKRIGKLLRMFSSPNENEATVALLKLRRLLPEEHLSFNDLAIVIENADGEIEERKYTDADMLSATQAVKARAEKEAYEKAQRERSAPPEFYDDSGAPRWYEIARFTKEKLTGRLKPGFETDFVEDAPAKMLSYSRPRTAKQARWILTFFVRAGGVVPTGIMFDGERIS